MQPPSNDEERQQQDDGQSDQVRANGHDQAGSDEAVCGLGSRSNALQLHSKVGCVLQKPGAISVRASIFGMVHLVLFSLWEKNQWIIVILSFPRSDKNESFEIFALWFKLFQKAKLYSAPKTCPSDLVSKLYPLLNQNLRKVKSL